MSDPVHFTHLKRMALSPAHYRYSVQRGAEETRAMRIGSVTHALVLGGEYHRYEGERRGKAWAEFRDEHSDGKTIVTSSELEDACAIAKAVLLDPVARQLVAGPGETEKTIHWSYLGRACSSRLDLVMADKVVELKISNTSSPAWFPRHAVRQLWHAQLAFYLRALDRPLTAPAYIIAVESAPPHPVTVLQLTDRALDYGERLCRLWMERLLVCEATDEWPGYAQSIMPLDVPDESDVSLVIDGEETVL